MNKYVKRLDTFPEIGEALKEFVKETSWTEHVYDVISAIRGNDVMNTELKRIFTSRIRWLIGFDGGKGATKPEATIYLETIKEAVKIMKRQRAISRGKLNRIVNSAYYHYLEHVIYAIKGLRTLGLIDHQEGLFLESLAERFHHAVEYNQNPVFENIINWEIFVKE